MAIRALSGRRRLHPRRPRDRCCLDQGVHDDRSPASTSSLAYCLAQLRGTLSTEEIRGRVEALARIPGQLERAVRNEPALVPLARRLSERHNFLYLGRGMLYPIALEGALKLKEISYIHAEGYPAGEMKHGPIALIDERSLPVLGISTAGTLVREDVQQPSGGHGRAKAAS